MAIAIRPADLSCDVEHILEILHRNLTDLAHRERFHWMYRQNPAGSAWSWLAYETGTREMVGVASLCPQMVWIEGEIRRCGQVRDFAIDVGHRSLGPAILLQRATFGPVDDGILSFCYDCPPDHRGMSTFRRMGIKPSCQMQRYARILRLDRKVSSILGNSMQGKAVGAMANCLMRVLSGARFLTRSKTAGIQISVHKTRFGEEFSELDQRLARMDTIRGRRAAEDLNWRYRDNPIQPYRVLTAHRHGELQAYLVYNTFGQDAYIIDLFGDSLRETGTQLLEAAVSNLLKEEIQTLHWVVNRDDDSSVLARAAGFSLRSDAACVVAYASPRSTFHTILSQAPRWQFTHAEIIA